MILTLVTANLASEPHGRVFLQQPLRLRIHEATVSETVYILQ